MSEPIAETVTTPSAVTVKYNHETRALTPEEAATYAQMGLKYEALQPTLDRLTALAAGNGQTLAQYITAAETDVKQAKLAQYTAAGDTPQAAAARVAEETLAAETTRLTAQLTELTEAVGIDTLDGIPAAVREDARQNGRTLLDAYLRHQWQQQGAVARERAAADTAAAAAVGSQDTPPPTDSTDSLTHAMLRGLHSVL